MIHENRKIQLRRVTRDSSKYGTSREKLLFSTGVEINSES